MNPRKSTPRLQCDPPGRIQGRTVIRQPPDHWREGFGLKRRRRHFSGNYSAVRQAICRSSAWRSHITKPDTDKDAELPVHSGAAAVIDAPNAPSLDRYAITSGFRILLLRDRFGRRLVRSLFDRMKGAKTPPSHRILA